MVVNGVVKLLGLDRAAIELTPEDKTTHVDGGTSVK
jgi:hypothetical protein